MKTKKQKQKTKQKKEVKYKCLVPENIHTPPPREGFAV